MPQEQNTPGPDKKVQEARRKAMADDLARRLAERRNGDTLSYTDRDPAPVGGVGGLLGNSGSVRDSVQQATDSLKKAPAEVSSEPGITAGGVGGFAKEVGRSVVRGVVKAGDEIVQTGADLADAVLPGDVISNDVIDDEWIDSLVGKRSENGFASFVEGMTQFATGFALGGVVGKGIGLAAKGTRAFKTAELGFDLATKGRPFLAASLEGMAKGAFADFAAMNPYDPGVDGLLKMLPGPARDLGEAIAFSEEDTGPVEARFRRMLEGAALGATIDVGLAFLRGARAARRVKAGTATKADLDAIVESNKTITEYAEGTLQNPDDLVQVVKASNGESFEIRLSRERIQRLQEDAVRRGEEPAPVEEYFKFEAENRAARSAGEQARIDGLPTDRLADINASRVVNGERPLARSDGTIPMGKAVRIDDEPGAWTSNAKDFKDLPEGWTQGEGMYHVTTDMKAVEAEGLKPRAELKGGKKGLGGGHNDQDPDLISVTYSREHAQLIEERLRLAVKAARGEVDFDTVYDHFADAIEAEPKMVFDRLGISTDGVDLSDPLAIHQALAGMYGDDLYDLVVVFDDAVELLAPGTRGRIGLTANAEDVAKIDPANIGTLEVQARKGAEVTHQPNEREFRFKPEDVRSRRLDSPMEFRTRSEAEGVALVYQMALRQRLSRGALHEAVEQTRLVMRKITQGLRDGDPELIRAIEDNEAFNLSYWGDTPETMGAIQSVTEVMGDAFFRAQRKDGVSFDEILEEAEKVLGSWEDAGFPDDFFERHNNMLAGLDKGAPEVQARMSAFRIASYQFLKARLKQVTLIDDMLRARPGDPVLMGEARQAMYRLYADAISLSAANSETGRTLRILQEVGRLVDEHVVQRIGSKARRGYKSKVALEPSEATLSNAEKRLKSFWEKQSDENVVRYLRAASMTEGNPDGIIAIAKASGVIRQGPLSEHFFELVINNLLGNPETHEAVWLTGLIDTHLRAFARVLVAPKEGAQLFKGMYIEAGRAAASGAKLSFGRDGQALGKLLRWKKLYESSTDLVEQTMMESTDALRASMHTLKTGEAMHRLNDVRVELIPGRIGAAIRVPGRAIGAWDEGIRAWAYRSDIRARAYTAAREAGLQGQERADYIKQALEAAYDPVTGRANEAMMKSLMFAEGPTMSGHLGSKTFGAAMSQMAQQSKLVRFLVLFRRAPVWLMRHGTDMSPLTAPVKMLYRAVAGKPILGASAEEKAYFATKLAIGTGLTGAAWSMVNSDKMTGGGPRNPSLRKIWLKNHQPYSVKIDGKWVSYRRTEPISFPMMLAADVMEVFNEAGEDIDSGMIEDGMIALIAGLSRTISDKAYLVGINTFMEAAVAGSKPAWTRFLANSVSATVPYSSTLRALNDDEYVRQANSIMERVGRGLPWFSEQLPPVYDPITGDPVLRPPGWVNKAFNPFVFSPAADDDVVRELLRVEETFPQQERFIGPLGVIDLWDRKWSTSEKGPRALETYYRHLAEQDIQGQLRDLFKTDFYKNLPEGEWVTSGPRKELEIAKIRDRAREQALQLTMDDHPAIRDAMREIERDRRGQIQSTGTYAPKRQDLNSLIGALK